MDDIATTVTPGRLTNFCVKHHIARLSLFGSALHGAETSESDVDILVEFTPGHTQGFAFAGIERELSELFGRKVDLHTAASLSRYFRTEVVREARPLYVSSKA